MNVERLLSVLDSLLEWTGRTGLEAKVNDIAAALQQVVNEPGNAAHAQNLAQKLTALTTVAPDDSLDDYPVITREIILEFGLDNLVAQVIEKQIRTLIQANAATPSTALPRLTEIRDEIVSDLKALRQIKSGLERFNVKQDGVDQDKAAVSFVIPRGEGNVPSEQLIADLKDFEFVENAFERIVTGRQTGARIKSLASSDFSVTLDSPMAVGLAVAIAIKYLIARYQEILNLRKSQIDLRRLKSDAAAEVVEKDITARIEKISDDVADKIIERFKKKAEEDRPLARKAVLKMARMIDNRYRIEVRVAVAQEDASDDEQAESKAAMQLEAARQEITEIQSQTRFFEAEKEPILLLPHTRDEEDASTDKK